MTNLELTVIRALARLSRMRKAVDCEALALRADGSLEEVRAALERLSRASLVDDAEADRPRLTMAGLTVAVASGVRYSTRRELPVRAKSAKQRAA